MSLSDVYKRQQGAHTTHLVLSYLQLLPECHSLALSGSGLHVYTFQGGGVGIEAIRIQRIHEPGPVSYTHLDVYKRQELMTPNGHEQLC